MSVPRMVICACGYCPTQLDIELTHHSFCHQDEENDPAEEFEEYLNCSVCGDGGKLRPSQELQKIARNLQQSAIVCSKSGVPTLTFVPAAHRHCARGAGSLAADEGT